MVGAKPAAPIGQTREASEDRSRAEAPARIVLRFAFAAQTSSFEWDRISRSTALDQRPARGALLPDFLEARSRSRAGSSSTMRAHLDNRSSRFRGRRIRAILEAGHRDGSRPRGRETRCFAATSVAECRCSKAIPTRASRTCLAPRHTVGAARATRPSPDAITWPSLKSPCNAPARCAAASPGPASISARNTSRERAPTLFGPAAQRHALDELHRQNPNPVLTHLEDRDHTGVRQLGQCMSSRSHRSRCSRSLASPSRSMLRSAETRARHGVTAARRKPRRRRPCRQRRAVRRARSNRRASRARERRRPSAWVAMGSSDRQAARCSHPGCSRAWARPHASTPGRDVSRRAHGTLPSRAPWLSRKRWGR
jgi:hypothetical protein